MSHRLRPGLLVVVLLVLVGCAGPSLPTPQPASPQVAQTQPTTAPPPATAAPKAGPPTQAPAPKQAAPTTTTAPKASPPPQTPTQAPTEAPAAVKTDANMQTGRLPGGQWFMGNPNAPVTLIDYSDFL